MLTVNSKTDQSQKRIMVFAYFSSVQIKNISGLGISPGALALEMNLL